jgi:hypothetical protein
LKRAPFDRVNANLRDVERLVAAKSLDIRR